MNRPEYSDFHTHRMPDDPRVAAVVNLNGTGNENTSLPRSGGTVFSAGIHPLDIPASPVGPEEKFSRLRHLAEGGFIAAVGEAGLDRRSSASMQVQTDIFVRQVKLAEEFSLPLIVHCVRAFPEIFQVRKTHCRSVWIIHSCGGNPEIARQAVAHDCRLSFGPAILRFNLQQQEMLKNLPIPRLCLETDDSEVDIKTVYRAAAAIRGVSLAVLQDELWNNFRTIFTVS